MRRIITSIVTGIVFSLFAIFPVMAAGWQQDATGWWWQNDDGTFPVNTWQWLDGNNDGIAECYYFDGNGYMLSNTTTPDGYQVNSDGAWVENDAVKQMLKGTWSGSDEYTAQTITYTFYDNGLVHYDLITSYSDFIQTGDAPYIFDGTNVKIQDNDYFYGTYDGRIIFSDGMLIATEYAEEGPHPVYYYRQ